LPSANASTNAGYNFGRTIDPTSNSFLNRSIGFNSLSLNASAPLYTGGQISNTIKQNKLSTEAARLDANTTVNNLSLDVAVAYLNILLSEEQLNNARKRLDLSKAQLEQTDRLIEAGSRPRNERLNLVSQVALDQQTVIEGENTVINNYLVLSQLMLLPPGEQIQIEKIDVIVPADVNPDTYKLVDVYNLALNTQPQIMAGEKRLASAQVAVEAAKASRTGATGKLVSRQVVDRYRWLLRPRGKWNGNQLSKLFHQCIGVLKRPKLTGVRWKC
jgi:outer membrane protein